MPQYLDFRTAVSAIKKHGMLLVFPIKDQAEPASLWSVAYPRTPMRWEWDEGGDSRVAKLWHLREELSRSREVIYTKWYQGRATVFSRPLFTALLSESMAQNKTALSRSAREMLNALEQDSPQSTKVLKRETGLTGKLNVADYSRGLKELMNRFLVVVFGEVDDGAFPSAALAATRLIFEELFESAQSMTQAERDELIGEWVTRDPFSAKYYKRLQKARG
jgi:hypothetical protein